MYPQCSGLSTLNRSLPSKNLSSVITWVPRVTLCPLLRSTVSSESEGTDVSFACCHHNTLSHKYYITEKGKGLTENPSSHRRVALPLIRLVRWITVPRSNFCLRWYAGRLGRERCTQTQTVETQLTRQEHTCSDELWCRSRVALCEQTQ